MHFFHCFEFEQNFFKKKGIRGTVNHVRTELPKETGGLSTCSPPSQKSLQIDNDEQGENPEGHFEAMASGNSSMTMKKKLYRFVSKMKKKPAKLASAVFPDFAMTFHHCHCRKSQAT